MSHYYTDEINTLVLVSLLKGELKFPRTLRNQSTKSIATLNTIIKNIPNKIRI